MMDPQAALSLAGDPAIAGLASEVKSRLQRALVAAEIARALDAELFVVDVRLQRDPSKPEVAICAFGQDEEPMLLADTAVSKAAAVAHSRPSLAAPGVKCHDGWTTGMTTSPVSRMPTSAPLLKRLTGLADCR